MKGSEAIVDNGCVDIEDGRMGTCDVAEAFGEVKSDMELVVEMEDAGLDDFDDPSSCEAEDGETLLVEGTVELVFLSASSWSCFVWFAEPAPDSMRSPDDACTTAVPVLLILLVSSASAKGEA